MEINPSLTPQMYADEVERIEKYDFERRKQAGLSKLESVQRRQKAFQERLLEFEPDEYEPEPEYELFPKKENVRPRFKIRKRDVRSTI